MTGRLKAYSGVLNSLLHLLDWAVVIITAFVASRVYLGEWVYKPEYATVILLILALSAWLFSVFELYRAWRGSSLITEIRQLWVAWSIAFLILAVLATLTKTGAQYSRGWILLWYLFGFGGLILVRAAVRLASRYFRQHGRNQRHIVIYGSPGSAANLVRQVNNAPWAGFKVSAVFLDQDQSQDVEGVPVVGDVGSIDAYVAEHSIDQVWIAVPLRMEESVTAILNALRNSTVDIRYFPDMKGMRLINHSVSEVVGMPVINLSASPLDSQAFLIKELEDKVLSILALVFLSPLFFVVAIGVKLSSPGPVFYRQERLGWNGRPFTMLKFRSMPVDSEKDGVRWGNSKEKKTTRFGAFIRRTSIDELPQFINVLLGDMSIVGPRPERTVFVEQFKDEIPNYMKKHLVKAGITGWAQVNGLRGDTDLAQRIEHDIYYIENWSLWFDLRILFLTVFRGMVAENAY